MLRYLVSIGIYYLSSFSYIANLVSVVKSNGYLALDLESMMNEISFLAEVSKDLLELFSP